MGNAVRQLKRAMICFLLLGGLSSFALTASPLPFTRIEVLGQMPVTEVFRVIQNQNALSFNLADSRNSIVQVGTYTLISNNSVSQFKMVIRPGEFGEKLRFSFMLDEDEPLLPGQLSELPFSVRVTSDVSRAVSVAGSEAMEKDLGVRGVYANNNNILYETGSILAEIPDFDPDQYATGWYSAAIQLSIEVL
ncbi:hypothetical protein SDC9_91634 [bioreactor metagenome]|jgi:hypothetical protein|uniref:DUF4402 domain-containing protein n=1 Tax=bioreactor metagenome TaxID=1076179 RepID=A0A644ZYD2_9ZZZZ|nr:hypothetical protein [Sphaerochaeta sp.]